MVHVCGVGDVVGVGDVDGASGADGGTMCWKGIGGRMRCWETTSSVVCVKREGENMCIAWAILGVRRDVAMSAEHIHAARAEARLKMNATVSGSPPRQPLAMASTGLMLEMWPGANEGGDVGRGLEAQEMRS